MIKLICLDCGNFTFFEAEVESVKAVEPTINGIVVSDAYYESWNYTDETIRGNLSDMVDYVFKEHNQVLQFDSKNNKYQNIHISCSPCGSRLVTIPAVEWQPRFDPMSLQDELLENRKDYLQLRKEKRDESNLPMLWQP